MREQTQDFFAVREDWSRRKHLILRYYLKPAVAKLRRASPDRRVIVLDGFAGAGRYSDGTEGSPVHMGALATEVRTWSDPVNLFMLNVEADPENYVKLEAATSGWVRDGITRNYNETFAHALHSILSEAGSSPLVAFLDPFRPKDLSFSDILPLLTRRSITEMLIVFHSLNVRRIIKQVAAEGTSEKTKSGSASRLDAIFGSARWQLLLSETTSDENVVSWFMEALLARSHPLKPHILATPIEARYGSGLKYHIVFVTRHTDGVRLMNDAFATERRDIHSQTGQMPQLFEEYANPLEPSQWTSGARRLLLKAASHLSTITFSFEELILSAIHLEPGQFQQTDFKRAARELLATAQKPRLIGVEGSKLRNGQWRVEDALVLRLDA